MNRMTKIIKQPCWTVPLSHSVGGGPSASRWPRDPPSSSARASPSVEMAGPMWREPGGGELPSRRTFSIVH